MSIAQRIFKHAKELSDLDELAKLIADPAAISRSAELAKKEAAAVQSLIDEAEAAKALIAKRDEVIAEINEQKANLENNISAFNAEREQFNIMRDSENARLSDFAAQLNLIEKTHKEKEAQISVEWSKIDNEKKALDNKISVALASAFAREAEAQKAIECALASEKRYNDLVAESRLKAANLAKIASEF